MTPGPGMLYPGLEVWLAKYPSIRPVPARITVATEDVAIAVIYGGGVPAPDRKQVLRFPPPDALSSCRAFPDEASAVAYWNGTVDRAMAELSAQYEENMKMLEGRRIPAKNEQEDTP